MSKKCQVSNKQANNAYSISHSHIRTKKLQNVNLQSKKVWSKSQRRWVKLRIATKCIKKIYTINI